MLTPLIERGKEWFRPSQQIVDEQGNIMSSPMSNNLRHGDWQDSAAYEAQLMSQYEQRAYDLSLWKYQQKFLTDLNSPKAQMGRIGEAGINPYLIAQNIQATAPAAAMQHSSPLKAQSNSGRKLQQVTSSINGILNGLSQVFELIQGARTQDAIVANQQAQARLTQEQANKMFLDNKAKEYLYFGENYFFEGAPGPEGNVNVKTFDDGIFARSEQNKVKQQEKQYEISEERRKYYVKQLEALGVSQRLAEEQVKKMESQFGWINGIKNDFVRTLCFWIMSNASLPGISFSGKMF